MFLRSIYRLICSSQFCYWEKMPLKLDKVGNFGTMMVLPEEYTCQSKYISTHVYINTNIAFANRQTIVVSRASEFYVSISEIGLPNQSNIVDSISAENIYILQQSGQIIEQGSPKMVLKPQKATRRATSVFILSIPRFLGIAKTKFRIRSLIPLRGVSEHPITGR